MQNNDGYFQGIAPGSSEGSYDQSHPAHSIVNEAHRLLGVYPFASATPTSHVSRHLGDLTSTAETSAHLYGATPALGPEYDEAMSLLGSSHVPEDPRQVEWWQNQRMNAFNLLAEEAGVDLKQNFSQNMSWRTPIHDSFATPPFARAVMQDLATVYQAPFVPFPGVLSPTTTSHIPSRTDSELFFNDFINRTNSDLIKSVQSTPASSRSGLSSQESINTPHTPMGPPTSSPDPLLRSVSSHQTVTPRKRKPDTTLQSPSIKRTASHEPDTPPQTPSTAATSSTLRSTNQSLKMLCVELPSPRSLFKTPTTSRSGRAPDSDLGGYGFVETPQLGFSSKSSTGRRDDRSHLEKLSTLLEDIFEAEDSIDPSSGSHESDFFSKLTDDWTRARLSVMTMAKFEKLVSKIARSRKKMRSGPTPLPVGSGGTGDLEFGILSRIMKILERSVKAGEDLDPFGQAAANAQGKQGSKAGNNARSSPVEGAPPEDVVPSAQEVSAEEIDRMSVDLEVLKEALLASECCIALLTSDNLQKQLYSEELITSCLSTTKTALTLVIYPFVESFSSLHTKPSPILTSVLTSSASEIQSVRGTIDELFTVACSVITRINKLFGADVSVSMSDSIVIQTVYVAIGPFFVMESQNTVGKKSAKSKSNRVVFSTSDEAAGRKTSMKGLRLEALVLIRNIFASHEEQRSWIIEEILTSLIRLPDVKQMAGQFKLRNGHSIHTVSALLLQLVQTSAHDVRVQIQRLASEREQSFVLNHQPDNQEEQPSGPTERDYQELQLYATGLEPATKAARTIITFLTKRSGKGKATKSSNDAEYRIILDNLISDLLVVLHWPEWPAASLVLNMIARFMISCLDDNKATADANALKSLALDHLGVITAKLRSSLVKAKQASRESNVPTLSPVTKTWDEVLSEGNIEPLKLFAHEHQEIILHLAKRTSEDQIYETARELTAVQWGQRLASALKLYQSHDEDEDEGRRSRNNPELVRTLKTALQSVWKDSSADVFEGNSLREVSHIDRLAEHLGVWQNIKSIADPALSVVIVASDASAVTMRTKALRALGQIVTSDPQILRNSKVRTAIEHHLLDNSPQVRDAAVELIGKYVQQIPELADDYYARIADRIADTGLSVRKRVVRLLKTFYEITQDVDRRVDVITRLTMRIHDEDDNVKDLAIKTIEELWFTSTAENLEARNSRTAEYGFDSNSRLAAKVSVIVKMIGEFQDRPTLEDLLHKIITEKDGKEPVGIQKQYTEICDFLIDSLVDANESAGQNIVASIKTIYVFSSAYPAIISGSKATTLIPYLKNASTSEEIILADYLLKIFRVCIPRMPRTATKFAADLQQALQPMVLKPSAAGGFGGLREAVACYCATIQYLSHDYKSLVGLLKSCLGRLRGIVKLTPEEMKVPATSRVLYMVISITSLLCEHCDFDKLREENQTYASELNQITSTSIAQHVYNILVMLYNKLRESTMRKGLLQCLGFLFKGYPNLMTLDESSVIMDGVFHSSDVESQSQLLKIIQAFLVAESAKHVAHEKASGAKKKAASGEVNMGELIGSSNDFADSGVSSAIMQRYISQILESALSVHPSIQAPAFEIMGFIVKQGLAHPLQCMPVIIALESSDNSVMSNRAISLHSLLHGKHATLINTRFLESCRASFQYQRKMCQNIVQGYRCAPEVTALLHPWYSLVREKRASRQDFLKAIVRSFDIVFPLVEASQDDIDFARYMAENVAALDYKTLEEVLTVIRHLTSVLSVAGTQIYDTYVPVADVLSSSQLSTVPEGPNPTESPINQENNAAATAHSSAQSSASSLDIAMAKASILVGIVLILKAHLKILYGLPEDKCLKWVPNKRSALGDKPATKRKADPITWSRMPFATSPMINQSDIQAQRDKFIELWQEDGVEAEPIFGGELE
ncbi:hypothetical protein SISNIDRAFT_454038 [Sistotremastrum niveocremeum HHB9708]|uniref:Sister chromatid cohesion protein n=1 Tax=Sistotremastrum niveocremeum HHB9708 TaxID=1314777 RepID=A0A164UXA4_9AGAM|nr:hypothetical protein SISNIDRAFT_454038 [Sistotremastrum niveocremeum HHB9708]